MLSWRDFRRDFASRWSPGEHASIMGRTGSGKSVLAGRGLLPLWDYTLTFDVKADGSVPIGRRLKSYPSWRQLQGKPPHHYRLSPGLGPGARTTFDDAFRRVWASGREREREGSWTLYIDELKIMSDKLKMRDHLETFWIAGRSRGITMIGSAQAPRNVPSDFYDQSTWLFFGPGMLDLRTLDRFGEITGNRQRLREVVPRLDFERHQFYVTGPGFEAVTAFGSRR